MEERIDPRSIDAMKTFGTSLEDADDKFKALERRMTKFNQDMDTIRARTTDFGQSMKDIGQADSFKDATKSVNEFHDSLKNVQRIQQETNPAQMNQVAPKMVEPRAVPTEALGTPMERAPTESVNKVEINTIRIDVSGVTDKTDKDKLARDISNRVTKELKSKMGGPLSSGGYNRGV
tara:strand:- start:1870 stop:2400 length:531 start_codon:yes stop_codon:yes gene_type:complete